MKIDLARDAVDRGYCSQCGMLRVKTPSGAVCPDHRLMLGVTEGVLRRAVRAKHLLELPRAERTPGSPKSHPHWSIEGMEGVFRRSRKGRVEAAVVFESGQVLSRMFERLDS